jgi:hypothetical protein
MSNVIKISEVGRGLQDVAHEVNDDLFNVIAVLNALDSLARYEAPSGTDVARIARVAVDQIKLAQDKLAPHI